MLYGNKLCLFLFCPLFALLIDCLFYPVHCHLKGMFRNRLPVLPHKHQIFKSAQRFPLIRKHLHFLFLDTLTFQRLIDTFLHGDCLYTVLCLWCLIFEHIFLRLQVLDIHKRFIDMDFSLLKIYVVLCKPQKFTVPHTRAEYRHNQMFMQSAFCLLQNFPLFFHSQYTDRLCLCFRNTHPCTRIKCDKTVMYRIFKHGIEDVIYISDSLCTVILVCHILQ